MPDSLETNVTVVVLGGHHLLRTVPYSEQYILGLLCHGDLIVYISAEKKTV